MSNKKRFFYAVTNLGAGRVTTSAVCQVDGTMFNNNALKRQIAQEAQVHTDNIYILHWTEFDTEQDYNDFFK